MSGSKEKHSIARFTAVGLFIGLPLVFIGLAVLNLIQLGDDQFAADGRQSQLAALTHRLDARTADAKPVDLSMIYVAGNSRSLASANLQQYIVDTVAASSGKLIETAAIDDDAEADPANADRLRLKTTLDTDNKGLLQLLYKLESGTPLLDVETLSIRRLPNEGDDTKTQTLRVDLAVRGQWRPAAI
jgi:hypothetical protein